MPDRTATDHGAGVRESIARLVAELRRRGVRPGLSGELDAHRALAALPDPADPELSRLALRAALCASRAEGVAFDAAYAEWLGAQPVPRGRADELIDPAARLALPRLAVPDPPTPVPPERREEEIRPAAYSDVELLRDKDFADYTETERALARRLIDDLARRRPTRPSRRTRAGRRRDGALDARATLRMAARRGGEPFDRRWREPRRRPTPLVLVCDVSGSMAPYSRVLLQYAQACVRASRRTEVFAFGTRLSRITTELGERDPDRALERATGAVADWSGGTRIGASIATLNREHGGRVGRGAIVVVLSDGWDRGEPELLGAELARLSRCAGQLVWLNPLSARTGYEPLVRGMVAALPHVDALVAGNSLASLAGVAAMIERGTAGVGRTPRRRVSVDA